VPATPEGRSAWTPPAVGNFALAVTGGYGPDANGMRGVGTWECTFRPPPGKPATPPVLYEKFLGGNLVDCRETLDVLGRQLHGSVVVGGKTPFSAGSGAGQVDYKRVCRSALSETGLITGFLRAVCSGSDALGFFSVLGLGDIRAAWFRKAALTTLGWQPNSAGGQQPPNKPSTPCVEALKEGEFAAEQGAWILKWSHDHDELASHKGATLLFAKNEIKELAERDIEGESSAKMNRSELLKVLCAMREKAQEENPPSEQEPPDSTVEIQAAGESDEIMNHALMQ